MPKMQPVLFYTVGYPGAGKTTVASALSFWLGGIHLRADKVGLELFRFPTFSPAERQAVHQEMQYRAAEGIRSGRSVIYDAATNAYAQRAGVAALGEKLGVPTIGLWIQVPGRLAMERAGKVRDSGVAGPVARVLPPAVFMQYVQMFEKPDQNENVIILSGEAPFALQYRRLARELQPYGLRLPRMMQ
ncbi:MAG TPA: ATP-binding protein [Candidatus Saccharimonadales bacterium]|nr:ATP-binding protein [Candidatus Saccharimonadales bacterium]